MSSDSTLSISEIRELVQDTPENLSEKTEEQILESLCEISTSEFENFRKLRTTEEIRFLLDMLDRHAPDAPRCFEQNIFRQRLQKVDANYLDD